MGSGKSVVVILAITVVAACSKPSASTAAGGNSWIANGASACEKYLTSDVVSAILTNPNGKISQTSSQACRFDNADSSGSIAITLTASGAEAFEHYQQYLVDPKPLAGVGDKATQSLTGIVAYKGKNRGCSIDAGGAPGSLKLRGADLGRKLGEICNKLFALP